MHPLIALTLLLWIIGGPAFAGSLLAPGEPLTHRIVTDLVGRTLAPDGEPRLRIEIDQPILPLTNRSGEVTRIALAEVEREPRAGRFRGLIRGSTEAGHSFVLPLAGRAVEMVEVPVPARPIGRGETIGASDIDWRELPATRLRRGALLDAETLIGSEARRPLRVGTAVTARDVGPPLWVRRGEPVRLIYEIDGLTIMTVGIAEEDGSENGLVRVTNADSRRQVRGRVTGPDSVTVGGGP